MNKHFVSKHRLKAQKTAGTFVIGPGENFVISSEVQSIDETV